MTDGTDERTNQGTEMGEKNPKRWPKTEKNTHLQMNKNVINSKCLRLIKIMIITVEGTKKKCQYKQHISGSI